MIEIDGGYLESGGQILRTAVALSAVTKKPCHVFNIRKGRPKPGLMSQHLLGIRALADLCQGRLEGDELGSEEIWFYPGEIQPKNLQVKIETAGSITLVLQTLILPCLFAPEPVKISFKGGATDTFFSPTIDHFRYVFLGILEKITGQQIAEVEIKKRGFYPEGGAEVEVKISPSKLKPINLIERGPLKKILVISGASEFLKQKKVAERQIAGAREVLGKFKLPIQEKIEYYPTKSPGSQINIIGEFENTVIGTDNLGKLNKSAEEIGKEVAINFLREAKTNAALDKHLADQILPFMAQAPGKSEVTVSEITNHCKTNIWVIEKFLDGKFEIQGNLITWLPKI
jgi:RNA 3'-phosphate cyclase